MRKRTKIILLLIVLSVAVYVCRLILATKKSDKELTDWNAKMCSQIESRRARPILVDVHSLYSFDEPQDDISKILEPSKKLPSLHTDYSIGEPALFPMLISDKIVVCQGTSLNILNQNIVYEYKCEIIECITYPKEEGTDIIFYLIRRDRENRYTFKEIRFSGTEFKETEIAVLDMPSSYEMSKLYSEVNFFTYADNTINVVLRGKDKEKYFCIFKFSSKGECLGKYSDGDVIIPNKYDSENLWYIKREATKEVTRSNRRILCSDKSILMKGENKVCEISGFINQGYFAEEATIEFMFADDSRMIPGDLDFVNGPYWLENTAYLFSVHEKKMTPAYFKKYWKSGNILQRGKILKDPVIVLF